MKLAAVVLGLLILTAGLLVTLAGVKWWGLLSVLVGGPLAIWGND